MGAELGAEVDISECAPSAGLMMIDDWLAGLIRFFSQAIDQPAANNDAAALDSKMAAQNR